MIFFFLTKILCLVGAEREINPGSTIRYIEQLDENDENFTLSIVNFDKKGLKYTIKEPSKFEDDDSYLMSEESHFDEIGFKIEEIPLKKTFHKKGTYLIQIANESKKKISYSIHSYVSKKVTESNTGVANLRSAVQSLSVALSNLQGENYYLSLQNSRNIKEAQSIRRMQNLLIVFPILIILIGYTKHLIARHMVKPRKKKFAKVF